MLWRLALAVAFILVAMALPPNGAFATPPAGLTSAGQADGLLVAVSDDDDDDDDDDEEIGGAIVFGLAYCAIQQQVCADRYDPYSWRYQRCLRDQGC
jgi:hypothetical protein